MSTVSSGVDEVAVVVDPADQLVVVADAAGRLQVLAVGLGGEDDALELGVRQGLVGDQPRGQQRPGRRFGVAHGGHRRRLHQGGRVRGGAVHDDGLRRPGVVRLVARGARVAYGPLGAVGELGGRSPVARERFEQRRLPAAGRRPPRAGGRRLRRRRPRGGHPGLPARGHAVEHGPEQVVRGGHRLRHRAAGGGRRPHLAVERLVDDRQAGLVGGAAALVEPAVDGGGEHDVGLRVGGGEQLPPVRVAGDGSARGDGDQSPAGAQGRVGGAHVPHVGVVAHAVEVRAARERRVHQHDARVQIGQQVPDVLGVVARDRRVGEAVVQQPRPGGGDLVQVEPAAGVRVDAQRGQRGEHAGAGRRLEHGVVGADGRGDAGRPGHLQRGRELLQAHLLVAAAGLRRLQLGDGVEQRQHRVGVLGLAQQGAAVADEQEHDGGLARLVGVLPLPGALGVGAAEDVGQRLAQAAAVDPVASLEGGQQAQGGAEDAHGGARSAPGRAVAARRVRRRWPGF